LVSQIGTRVVGIAILSIGKKEGISRRFISCGIPGEICKSTFIKIGVNAKGDRPISDIIIKLEGSNRALFVFLKVSIGYEILCR